MFGSFMEPFGCYQTGKSKLQRDCNVHTETGTCAKNLSVPVWTYRPKLGTGQFTWWGESIPPQLLYAPFSVNNDTKECNTQSYNWLFPIHRGH